MAIPLAPVTLTPGIPIPISLGNPGGIQAVKLSNGTPFDLTISGFGIQGQGIVPAGLEVMLHAEVENTGTLTMLPVNNSNVSGTGVANIVVYVIGEKLPPGNWPVTIPTQIVQAKVSTVTTLVNDGSAAATQIVESTPSGDPGSAVSLLNTGVLALGNATHHGSISSDNGAFKTDGNGNVTSTSETTGSITASGDINANGAGTGLAVTNNETVGGTLGVTGAATVGSLTSSGHVDLPNNNAIRFKDTGGTLQNTLNVDTANEVDITAVALGNNIKIQDHDGSIIAAFKQGISVPLTGTGTIDCGKVLFNIGGIKDINQGAVTPGSLQVTVNHGLSGAPASVMTTTGQTGSTVTSGASAFTSTQFTLNVGVSGIQVAWLAYR